MPIILLSAPQTNKLTMLRAHLPITVNNVLCVSKTIHTSMYQKRGNMYYFLAIITMVIKESTETYFI